VSLRHPDDTPLDPTAERVAEFLSAQAGPLRSASSSERDFVRRLAGFRRARRNRKRVVVGLTVACTFVALGLGGSRLRDTVLPGAALSYRVDDQAPPSGGDFLASPAAGSLLTFTDGSKVRMAARTRGRVVDVDSRGAKFALDDGKVTVDVVPRPRARWIFEAGPFRVNVHGTSFTVAWNAVEAVFELRLVSGVVSVASPLAGSEIRLLAGQTLRVNLRDQTSTIGKLPESSDPPAAPSSLEPAAPPAPSQAARWSHRGWTTVLSQSRAGEVVADADRRGIAAVLERADADDLWALANAARYVGRYRLAQRALRVHRERFPSSDRARQAAFLLGRLHDGDADGPETALQWYDRYLTDAHDGPSASDALGRKMTLLQRWNRRAEALSVAENYLRRFPRGTYANAARALVRSSIAGQ
jgi:TolA-binding protein